MSIQSVFSIILKRVWIVAICALIAAAAAAIVNATITPSYESVTLLTVNQLSSNGSLTDYDSILANGLLAKTYAETLINRTTLNGVIERLSLPYTAIELEKHVSVDIIPDTQLLHLRVTDSSPQRAADIANTIVTVFREHNQSVLSQRYAIARQSLEAELVAAREKLDTSARVLDELRATKNVSEVQLRDAEILVNQDRNAYAALSEALSKVLIAETQSADSIDLIEEASPGDIPVWPKPILNIAVATVVGLLLGAFAALLLGEPHNSRVVTPVREVKQTPGVR